MVLRLKPLQRLVETPCTGIMHTTWGARTMKGTPQQPPSPVQDSPCCGGMTTRLALGLMTVLLALCLLADRLRGGQLAPAPTRERRIAAAIDATSRWRTDELESNFLAWALFAHVPARKLVLDMPRDTAEAAAPPTFQEYQVHIYDRHCVLRCGTSQC